MRSSRSSWSSRSAAPATATAAGTSAGRQSAEAAEAAIDRDARVPNASTASLVVSSVADDSASAADGTSGVAVKRPRTAGHWVGSGRAHRRWVSDTKKAPTTIAATATVSGTTKTKPVARSSSSEDDGASSSSSSSDSPSREPRARRAAAIRAEKSAASQLGAKSRPAAKVAPAAEGPRLRSRAPPLPPPPPPTTSRSTRSSAREQADDDAKEEHQESDDSSSAASSTGHRMASVAPRKRNRAQSPSSASAAASVADVTSGDESESESSQEQSEDDDHRDDAPRARTNNSPRRTDDAADADDAPSTSSHRAPQRKRRRRAPLNLTRRRAAKRPTVRGRTRAVGDDDSDEELSLNGASVPRYKCVNRIREGHGQPLYFVAFNSVDARHADIFASAGGNRVTVYRALPSGAVDPIQLYVDEDPRESIYALAWSIDLRTGSPLLLIAGQNGVIKVVDVHTRRLVRRLVGHGSSVNELKLHPRDLHILLSVSKDMSVRLWNVTSGDCVAIFAGDAGHRDEVLSGDFHASGDRIVSSGMDHAIMVWDISDRVKSSLAYSYRPAHERDPHTPFPTVLVQYPAFSTNQVHANYVDHCKYFGDFILSKSTEEKIVMWKIRNERKKQSPHRLVEYTFTDCDIWYIRFAMDLPRMQYLCVGNKTGSLFMWNLDSLPVAPPRRLSTPHSQRAIRCVAFSQDARILLAACEDGTLFRWDQITQAKGDAAPVSHTHTHDAHVEAAPPPPPPPHSHDQPGLKTCAKNEPIQEVARSKQSVDLHGTPSTRAAASGKSVTATPADVRPMRDN